MIHGSDESLLAALLAFASSAAAVAAVVHRAVRAAVAAVAVFGGKSALAWRLGLSGLFGGMGIARSRPLG